MPESGLPAVTCLVFHLQPFLPTAIRQLNGKTPIVQPELRSCSTIEVRDFPLHFNGNRFGRIAFAVEDTIDDPQTYRDLQVIYKSST